MGDTPGSTDPAPVSSAPAIRRLGQVGVTIRDPDRAVAFYRDVLGLPLLFSAGRMAFFDCGGVRLMLAPPEVAEVDHPSSILYFDVADIQAAHRNLVAHGVTSAREPNVVARMPDHDLWLCEFRDSEGNVLAYMSEVRH